MGDTQGRSVEVFLPKCVTFDVSRSINLPISENLIGISVTPKVTFAKYHNLGEFSLLFLSLTGLYFTRHSRLVFTSDGRPVFTTRRRVEFTN